MKVGGALSGRAGEELSSRNLGQVSVCSFLLEKPSSLLFAQVPGVGS